MYKNDLYLVEDTQKDGMFNCELFCESEFDDFILMVLDRELDDKEQAINELEQQGYQVYSMKKSYPAYFNE